MTRAVSHSLLTCALLGSLAFGLGACGETSGPSTPDGSDGTQQSDSPDGTDEASSDKPGTAAVKPVVLPEMGPLTQGLATDILRAPFGSLATLDPEMVRAALGMLARLGDRALVDAVNAELLVKDDGEYHDTESAAIGLLALHQLGEKDAADRILALAKFALDDEDIDLEAIAIALDAVPGAKADALLIRLVEVNDDEFGSTEGLRALARRRVAAALPLFKKVAAEAQASPSGSSGNDYTSDQHVLAVAGLLGLGDPAGMDQIDRWAAVADSAVDLDDVLVHLGVRGLTEAADAVVRIMDAVIEADAIAFEPASACIALGEIFYSGGGEAYRDHIRSYRDLPDSEASDEAHLALLRTGDVSVLPQVAAALERAVADPFNQDAGATTAMLETITSQGLSGDPSLAQILAVGAQLRPEVDAKPGPKDRAMLVNCACAYAYLASRQ
jgi:hypothetical protein